MASNKPTGDQPSSPVAKRRAPRVALASGTLAQETDALLGRQTPPPRYSTLDPTWEDDLGAGPSSGQGAGVVPVQMATSPPPQLTQQLPVIHPQQPPAFYPQESQQQPIIRPNDSTGYPGWWSWVPGPAQFFPPGLEHLCGTDELTLHKKGRKYQVLRNEQQVFTVAVLEDACQDFTMKLLNNANLEVLILNKTLETEGCCSSSSTHVEVMFPPGNTVGVVQGHLMEYTVYNPSGDLLYFIQRDATVCCGRTGYQVATKDSFIIGRIFRQKSSSCCGSKVVMIIFPHDLELRSKALILAAALTIRHMHW